MIEKRLLYGFLALALSATQAACYRHLNQPAEALPAAPGHKLAQTLTDIEYTQQHWPQSLHADLYLPDAAGLRPVVITVHGGGWANRDRSDMASLAEKLVGHGYAVFNINYRFAPRHTYPAQLHDLEQALDWIAVNAARYRLDPTRINAWGYSSGAHLAALLASRDSSRASKLPAIRAVVAGGIPADLRKYPDSPIISRFIGGGRDEMITRYTDASPIAHVSADDPPVFLYHGKYDMMVGVDQASDYYAALRAGGVDAELYLHNWHGHISMFLLGGDAERRAIAFLNRNNIDSGLASLP